MTILRVRCPNQQCHSTEGRRLVDHVKGQSHQAHLTKRHDISKLLILTLLGALVVLLHLCRRNLDFLE